MSFARPVTRAIVFGAIGGAVAAWVVASIFAAFAMQRAQNQRIAMIGTILRRNLADADEPTVRDRLPSIEKRLAGLDLQAQYVPERIANTPSAPVRNMAIVPTRDGHLMLSPLPASVWRVRLTWLAALLVAVGLAAVLALLAGGRWAEARERTIAQGDDRLRAFLADAAHELRTPLAIAVGYTGILRRGGSSDRELTDRIVGDIATEHDRLSQLIERILQLARLDAVGGDRRVACDAVRVAQEAIALVRPLDPDRTIELDAPNGAPVAISSDDLRDALRNVLDNALRYAPGAPIAVRVVTDGDVVIRVSDGGPGMDPFTAQHAFDRFFRGADRGSIPGSGLGLSIVRRIVERAGGRVALDTGESGTTVELRLRRSRSSPAA